jgi:hypothetical protein
MASSSQATAKESWYARAVTTTIDSPIDQFFLYPCMQFNGHLKLELSFRPDHSNLRSWYGVPEFPAFPASWYKS